MNQFVAQMAPEIKRRPHPETRNERRKAPTPSLAEVVGVAQDARLDRDARRSAASGLRDPAMPSTVPRPTLELLLGSIYPGDLAPDHRADLQKSGLTDRTIAQHKIRSIPPSMIDRLLGFDAPKLTSAYIIPFPDPQGGWIPHVRMKVFPAYVDGQGRAVKYLGPIGAAPRLYFPIPSIPAVTASDAPVWLVEGAKKALAVAQLGLPAVGFEGIEGWHAKGASMLLADFDTIPLRPRLIELVPDGDIQTNPNVRRGAIRFADALRDSGARPRLVRLPAGTSRSEVAA